MRSQARAQRGATTSGLKFFAVFIALVRVFPNFWARAQPCGATRVRDPFSMIWVIFWIGVEFVVLVAFFLSEEKREAN
ncbi:MAG: hypothetical protein CM1200mP4_4360 [Rhodospirillaceae bacterium]|nr:MAG: hypothetical protein CM1200mP4_4360 [Rhodospirillaceae bacterium]